MKVSELKNIFTPIRNSIDLTPVFRQISQSEMGSGALVTCTSIKESKSLTSALYSAYNKNHEFVKTRGFGVRIWRKGATTLQVIKISADEVLSKKKQMVSGIDRVLQFDSIDFEPAKRKYTKKVKS